VRAELNGVHMRTFGEGSFLHDLHFFDKTLLPYNIIGNEPGVLGSVNADAIESLAVSRPLLALAFMRRIGNSAVRTIREDAILERNDTSTIKKNQRPPRGQRVPPLGPMTAQRPSCLSVPLRMPLR
jgi:hypothetical protein